LHHSCVIDLDRFCAYSHTTSLKKLGRKNWRGNLNRSRQREYAIISEKEMISKNDWDVYCTRFLVRARRLTEPMAFTDPFGHEHVGRPGDYLVETSNGIRRIAARAFFEDAYVLLSVAGPELAEGDLRRSQSLGVVTGARDRVAEDRPRAMA
jgi:hypothetical protein